MKTLLTRWFTKSYHWLQLLRCAYVLMWRSAAIVIANQRHQLTRAQVNKHFRRGSIRILSLARANYAVNFDPQFSLQPKVCYIFMSNHLSSFDLPFIFATLPGAIRLIAKKELFQIPLFGNAAAACELLPVHPNNPEAMPDLLNLAQAKLTQGIMLWIFPEGARSTTGELLPFKHGGFRLARETGAHIIPVGIAGTDRALPAFTLQLHLNQSLTMSVGKPIDTHGYHTPDGQKQLMRLVRDEISRLSTANASIL